MTAVPVAVYLAAVRLPAHRLHQVLPAAVPVLRRAHPVRVVHRPLAVVLPLAPITPRGPFILMPAQAVETGATAPLPSRKYGAGWKQIRIRTW